MKKTIFLLITFLIIFVTISFVYINKTSNLYNKVIIDNNYKIVANIIDKHPELEEEIMNTILLNEGNKEIGRKLLEKYGIDEISIENLSNINKIKSNVYNNNFILIFTIFLIISIIYIKQINKQNNDIKKITKYLDKILKNEYDMDIRDYKEGEISNLKNDIYKITTLLREKENYSVNEKKHLENILSDISHQLKTPLTSMYVINDILSNETIEKTKKKEMLNKNRIQLERIEWLVTSLLKLSRLDSDMVTMKSEKIKIYDLVDHALEPLKIPIELKNQKTEIIGNRDITINIDFNWTVEALINIIKNAHEHTKELGHITITFEENPIYVLLTIKDNGEGIRKEDLPHIFKRFYRCNNNKESIGIGLNMAKTIIQKQNAYITVTSEINNYTEFNIKFYKNEI